MAQDLSTLAQHLVTQMGGYYPLTTQVDVARGVLPGPVDPRLQGLGKSDLAALDRYAWGGGFVERNPLGVLALPVGAGIVGGYEALKTAPNLLSLLSRLPLPQAEELAPGPTTSDPNLNNLLMFIQGGLAASNMDDVLKRYLGLARE